jgi:hypothetical protein
MNGTSSVESTRNPTHGCTLNRNLTLCSRLITAVLISVLCGGAVLPAQQPSKPSEYQVKAAYLYNFGKFVDWSATNATDKDDSFSICVLGQDPFGAALDATLAGQTVGGHKAIAKRISGPDDAVACRILFISSSEDNRLKDILPVLNRLGILTVSDIPQFSQRGGMIQFVTAENRIRFEVNLKAVEDAGLTLSSELLKVAVTVRKSS